MAHHNALEETGHTLDVPQPLQDEVQYVHHSQIGSCPYLTVYAYKNRYNVSVFYFLTTHKHKKNHDNVETTPPQGS